MGEKKQIRIAVKDKIACLVDEEQFLVCGNNDYEVVFDFDSDWEGISAKTAVFVYGNTPVHKPFVGNVCEGIEIKNATLCAIGVFAGNIKTTTGATIECRQSIRDLGGVPKPPSKEVYDEIMELLDKAIEAHTELPVGGKKGQVLKKVSDEDYDTDWEDDEQRDLTEIEEKIESLDEDISNKVGKSEFNIGILETKEYAETLVNPIAEKQTSLEERVTDLESLTLTYIEDGSTAYEKTVPANVGSKALIKAIGGATKRVIGKNLIKPTDISWVDHSGADKFSYTINADGTITYTTNSQGLYVFPDISNLDIGRYYIYVEGALRWNLYDYVNSTTLEIDCSADFDDNLNDYLDTTRTLKVMIWRDESVTTDTLEIVEAPEGTVFEPYHEPYLEDVEVERVESIGADSTTVIDTLVMPEEVKLKAVNDTYYDYIEFKDDKVFGHKVTEKIVLNGSEDWINVGNAYFALTVGEYGTVVPHTAICDKYEVKSPAINRGMCISVTNSGTYNDARIMLRTNEGSNINMSIENFKKQLAEKPITIIYALANPEVTDITDKFIAANPDFLEKKARLSIERGGVLRFVNKDKMPVPSSVWFTTRKE